MITEKQFKKRLARTLLVRQNKSNNAFVDSRSEFIATNRLINAIQRKQNKVNDFNSLQEGDAKKLMIDMFKKKKFLSSGMEEESIQRTPDKSSYLGGDLFTVSKSDLGHGTLTNSTTQDYVNESSTPKPTSVYFDYATASGKTAASGLVKQSPLAYGIDNPVSDFAYSTGRIWDAGHKLGRQNGGLGDNKDWVFPQTPAFNQGNSRLMNGARKQSTGATYPLWREHENTFHDGVESDGAGCWWIKPV